MNIFLKDKNGEPSATLTMFVTGCIVVFAKLIFSGIQLTDSIKLTQFTGIEFAAAIAALGGVYTLRKNNKSEKKE
jgi:hypothetical protein